MKLKETVNDVLKQLQNVIEQINLEDYTGENKSIDSSIGEHARHIIEFYVCLLQGLKSGVINYDNRQRDKRIESDPDFAISKIGEILSFTENYDENPTLTLNQCYSYTEIDNLTIQTNYLRELTYNIEHTIHHLAIMKTAINERCNYIDLPGNFGIASSTVRYSNTGK